MIILTQAQCEALCGPLNKDGLYYLETTKGHAIVPAPLKGGLSWAIHEDVLADPAHFLTRTALQVLPKREVLKSEFPDEGEKPGGISAEIEGPR